MASSSSSSERPDDLALGASSPDHLWLAPRQKMNNRADQDPDPFLSETPAESATEAVSATEDHDVVADSILGLPPTVLDLVLEFLDPTSLARCGQVHAGYFSDVARCHRNWKLFVLQGFGIYYEDYVQALSARLPLNRDELWRMCYVYVRNVLENVGRKIFWGGDLYENYDAECVWSCIFCMSGRRGCFFSLRSNLFIVGEKIGRLEPGN